jgi:fructokinase
VITVVGEALVDVVQRPGRQVAAHPGGSPANVAVALARLGTPVGLVTRLGRDEYGRLVRAHLVDNGVALLGQVEGDAETSVAEATLDDAGIATYFFRLTWDLEAGDLELADDTVCLHTGSLATAIEPGATSVRRLLEQAQGQVTLSYDPNCRPAILGAPESAQPGIESLAAICDIVKVSEEDLAWLYPGEPYAACAQRWLAGGPAIVVVTLGGNGAYAVTRSTQIHRPAPPTEVVDTVGAGDAFMAGLIDGLTTRDLLGPDRAGGLAALDEETLTAVLDEASLVAALTVSRAGADPPTRDELEAHSAQRQTADPAPRPPTPLP